MMIACDLRFGRGVSQHGGTVSMDDLTKLVQRTEDSAALLGSKWQGPRAPRPPSALRWAFHTGDTYRATPQPLHPILRRHPYPHVRLARRRKDASRTAPQPPRAIMIYRASPLIAALSLPAHAQQPIIYPSKGQSAEQQQKDQGECMAWAQQTTGVNPAAVAQGLAADQPQSDTGFFQDERVQGAVVGAAGGAAIGAIAGGHAGKGAGIGAIVGTLAGGAHREHKSDEAQARTRANQQQAQQSVATYNRAYGACLEGRGYTVR